MENSLCDYYECEQGSEAWFDLHVGRITGSMFIDMMAATSTLSYKKKICQKVGEIITGKLDDDGFIGSAAMVRGKELEPEARNFYIEMYETDVSQVGFVTNRDLYPDFIGVSPDGMIEDDNGLIEIKCPSITVHLGYLQSGGLPSAYKWQVQGQLLVTGASYCDFLSYYPGVKHFLKRVYPDEKYQEQLKVRMAGAISDIKDLLDKLNT